MKRLVITGLACPPETWEEFLGDDSTDQKILPIHSVFERTSSSDLREMAHVVASEIKAFQPDSIVAHDLGVPLTILGLLNLRKRGFHSPTKVTFFNGAFRKFDVFRSHLFRAQWMSARRAVYEIESHGGIVDLRLKKFLPRIRSMSRNIIFYDLRERLSEFLGTNDLLGIPQKIPLKTPVQIIASTEDPFIPKASLAQLRHDCRPQKYVELNYGHFPYRLPRKKILPLIEEFEHRTFH